MVVQVVVVCSLTYRDLLSQRRRGVIKVQQANKMRPVAGGFSHTDGEAVSGSLGLSPFDLVPAFKPCLTPPGFRVLRG